MKIPPSDSPQLSSLVDMTSPAAVHAEVVAILHRIDPQDDWQRIHHLFHFTDKLYNGLHPGYKACDTEYHDFQHVTDTYLAMARLLHGAIVEGESFSPEEITMGLSGALLHDVGMIRHIADTSSGAEYVKEHVERSMDFVARHAVELEFTASEVKCIRNMILCTDLAVDPADIRFSSRLTELLGKMLGTADLMGQMAVRDYLEKLLFLFHEFRKADVGDCESEIEFLHKTLEFYEICDQRFDEVLDKTYQFMVPHFRERWHIEGNLYTDSLNRQRHFLQTILADQDRSPYDYLKRSGIVQKVRRKFGSLGMKNS